MPVSKTIAVYLADDEYRRFLATLKWRNSGSEVRMSKSAYAGILIRKGIRADEKKMKKPEAKKQTGRESGSA